MLPFSPCHRVIEAVGLPSRKHGQMKATVISKRIKLMKGSRKEAIALQGIPSGPGRLNRSGGVSRPAVPVRKGGQLQHGPGLLDRIETIQFDAPFEPCRRFLRFAS